MSNSKNPQLSRRHVFAGAGAVGALAAAVAVLPQARQQPAAMAERPAPEDDGRYQLTQHVLRYYQTAKV